MNPQLYQSTDSNPTIEYRTPTGQTQSSPLSEAPPQIQLLYQQLPQAQAQTATAQAGAVSAQAGAQKSAASINLGNTMSQNAGYSLSNALSDYSSVMDPNEIFNQYLAAHPNQLPLMSPTELRSRGVSDATIGQIGQNGSYADRWNTRSAIQGLQDLQAKWNAADTAAKIPFLSALDPTASAYSSAKTIFGEHLSSLIPGGSGAQGSVQNLTDALPSIGDLTQLESGKAAQQFSSVESQLLAAKGYNYSDLGLSAPKNTPASGGGLLSALLHTALPIAGGAAGALIPGLGETGLSEAGGASAGEALADLLTGQQMGLDVPLVGVGGFGLSKLAGLLRAGGVAAEGVAGAEGGGGAAVGSSDLAGNPLMNFIRPGAKITRGIDFNNAAVAAADKAGTTISGTDDIAANIRQWADKAKLANPADTAEIEQAAVNAEKEYAGKTFTPSEVKDIFLRIPDPYTAAGALRTPTAAYIDNGVKQSISKTLDDATNGAWSKGTAAQKAAHDIQNSAMRKTLIKLAPYGLGIAGMDQLQRILQGIGL